MPTIRHIPGELSLLVRLPGRNVILTGDTVHLREALTTIAPTPYDADTVESLRSIRRLDLLRESADATIRISHDLEDWAEFGHAHRTASNDDRADGRAGHLTGVNRYHPYDRTPARPRPRGA